MDNRPIGVFDSGIGGLTVLKELMVSLPQESFVYFGDTARVPYGTRSKDTIIKYSFQCVRFLLSKDVKAIVIACNTSSAASLSSLKQKFDLPVIGVIEPGAVAAVGSSRNGRVGIIGTSATVNSGAHREAIKKIDDSRYIVSNPCPLFVPLVEEGWSNTQVASMVAEEYLKPLMEEKVDTVVMGCTHYPLLKGIVGSIMGPDVKLIDPAYETAREFKSILDQKGMRREDGVPPQYKYYVSDDPEKFVRIGAAFLEKNIDNIEKIDIDKY